MRTRCSMLFAKQRRRSICSTGLPPVHGPSAAAPNTVVECPICRGERRPTLALGVGSQFAAGIPEDDDVDSRWLLWLSDEQGDKSFFGRFHLFRFYEELSYEWPILVVSRNVTARQGLGLLFGQRNALLELFRVQNAHLEVFQLTHDRLRPSHDGRGRIEEEQVAVDLRVLTIASNEGPLIFQCSLLGCTETSNARVVDRFFLQPALAGDFCALRHFFEMIIDQFGE